MQTPKVRVVVFDSGVGGLHIINALRSLDCELIFVSDNAELPYGTKSEAELKIRVHQLADVIVEAFSPDVIVIACNTASTVVLPSLRRRLSLPIIGVVPAIKPAAALSDSRVIGLLATPATIQRAYTRQLIDDFASDCEVVLAGSTLLVHEAEEKLRGKTPNLRTLQTELLPFQKSRPDVIVLGCTHFPLLLDELQQALGYSCSWLDSAPAIARRLQQVMTEVHPKHRECDAGSAFFTKLDDELNFLKRSLLDKGLSEPKLLLAPKLLVHQ